MRALFFGTYDTRSHPRVGVLIEGLREHDFLVSECNQPLGVSTAARVAMLQRPWLLPLLGVRLGVAWLRLVRAARRIPPPDLVVVGYLGHFDVRLARRLFPRAVIVLDHLIGASDTASDRGVSGGLRQRLLRWLDARALAAADIVLVDTEEHLAALPPAARAKALAVAVGAPAAWFAETPPDGADDTAGPLRAVFFGLFTPLQGAPVIGAALAELATEPGRVAVTMVGSGQDLAETRRLAGANPDVTWHDWVAPTELAQLVAGHDVCLGIFGVSPKALRVVPNKVFQGAAAGCAIVTSDTAPQRRLFGPAATYVPPGDGKALAAALRNLDRDRDLLRQVRSASRMLAQASFTPAGVTAPLAHRLETLTSEVRP